MLWVAVSGRPQHYAHCAGSGTNVGHSGGRRNYGTKPVFQTGYQRNRRRNCHGTTETANKLARLFPVSLSHPATVAEILWTRWQRWAHTGRMSPALVREMVSLKDAAARLGC